MPNERDLDQLAINTIRTLAIDAIEKANSAIRARQWALRQRHIRYGSASCGMTRSVRIGSTAIASCYRVAMRQCCCTR